jgi:membrane fusion protein (multidrug efflux system)
LAVGIASLWGLPGCGSVPSDQTPHGAAAAQVAQAKGRADASATPEAQTEAIPITIAEVVRRPIAAYLQGTATLESPAQVQVLAKTAGLAVQVAVEEGTRVEQGQLLVQLDDHEARLALERAHIQLAEAELAYKSLVHLDQKEAKLELRRAQLTATEAQELYRKSLTMERRGLASQQEVEAARTKQAIADVAVQQAQVRLQYKTTDDARFRYERAQIELKEVKLRLRDTTITAPITGVISARQVVPGQFVNTSGPLLTIVNTTRLLARTFLPENVSHQVQVGQPAHLDVEALPARKFPARVQLISPVVDAQSGTFKVTLEVLQPTVELKPGMFVTAFITVSQHDNALVIPKRALTLDSPEPTVYRLRDGRAYRATLRLGFTDGEQVEVTSGLTAGDQVVVMGQDKLLDGTAVQVVESHPLDRHPTARN